MQTESLPVKSKKVEPCTIILAEDDQDDRMHAMHKFKQSSLVRDVISVPDGTKLVDYMKEEGFYDRSVMRYNPMVIVIDLQMPKMDGFEILREIKEDSFLKEIPVVVLSSLKTDQSIAKAFNLGADGFLRKPLQLKKIEAFLHMGWQWPPKDLW